MKKFRIFALMAVLATFSTVFAAWQYVSYANEYKKDSTLNVTIDTSAVETKSAISIAIDNAEDVTVHYAQDTVDPYKAVATVSDDIAITVTEGETGAIEKYEFYYAVLGGDTTTLGSIQWIEDVETDGVVDYTKLTALEIDAEGKGVISAEELEPLFTESLGGYDYSKDEQYNKDLFTAVLTALVGNVKDSDIVVKVYAKKV